MRTKSLAFVLTTITLFITITAADAFQQAATPIEILKTNSLLPPVLNLAIQLTPVDINYSDAVNDPHRHVLYVSEEDPINGNGYVTTITYSGVIGQRIPLTNTAGFLAIAPDGRYLYAIINTLHVVNQIDLNTKKVTATWPLIVGDEIPRQFSVNDMVAMPGSEAVIVSRTGLVDVVPNEIAIYDAGGIRPSTFVSSQPMTLELGPGPDTLFGSEQDGGLWVFQADGQGISFVESHPSLDLGLDLVFQDGLLFGNSGCVASIEPYQQLGCFNTSGDVAPDVAAGYAYILHEDRHTYPYGQTYMEIFDIQSFTKVASGRVPLPEYAPQASDLVDIGNELFAIRGHPGLNFMRLKWLDQAVAIPIVSDLFCDDFFDDFSTDLYGWHSRNEPLGFYGYYNDSFRIVALKGQPLAVRAPVCFRPNYQVEVDLRVIEGSGFAGITYQHFYEQWYSGYGAIDPDLQQWRLSGNPETYSDLIRTGDQVNRLSLAFDGDSIIFMFINDVPVQYTRMEKPEPAAAVGLIVVPMQGEDRLEVLFDNFRYTPLRIEMPPPP